MGSGGSSFSQSQNEAVSAMLPPEIFKEFCRLEQDCEKLGKSPQETYRFLSSQYQEYIEAPDKSKFSLRKVGVPVTPGRKKGPDAKGFKAEELMELILQAE